MASVRPQRTSPPPLPDFEGPVDHALTLLLADETEAALRWGAAALERTPHAPGAVVVTSRLLERMGRMRAAIDGLRFATRQAIEGEDLPLAVVAIEDLKTLGVDVSAEVEEVAAAFCRESPRLEPAPSSMRDLEFGDFQPLSPFLAGPALASKAAQILQSSKRILEEAAQGDKPALSALPLFSALSKPALHELLAAFKIITVPAGHRLIEEGAVLDEAYVVAHGELEISRQQDDRAQGMSLRAQDVAAAKAKPPIVLARLGRGAFVGEMAAVSKLAAPSTVTATRPSILLVATRAALEAIAAKYPDAAVELAAHCRRHMVANLGWTSPVIASMPARERTALVERLEMRFFDRGEKLVQQGEDAAGLYLIISGDVAIVGRDGRERVALASLGAGETVGEVELVLCRKANAEAVALRPTAALFLSREDFFALVEEHPAVLYGLYAIAVRRYNETQLALQAGSEHTAESLILELDEAYGRGPGANRSSASAVPAASVEATPVTSHVDTPAGPPVAISPTIFVREAAPATSRSERGDFPTLLPPNVRPSQTPRSPRVAAVAAGASASTTTRRSQASFPPADTRSMAPTTSTLPPGRPTPRREPSTARQAVRAVGLAAVAAGVVAAALVASRDTQTGGGLGSAAAAAGREPAAPTTDTASGSTPSQGSPAAPPAPAPQKTTRTSTAAATPKWGAMNAAKSPVRPAVAAAPAQNSPRASEGTNVRSVPAPASSMAPAPSAPAASVTASAAAAAPAVTMTTIAAAPSVAPPAQPVIAAPSPEPKAPNASTKAIDDEFGGRQ